MSISSKAAIAAGVCGVVFLGYCVYFDRKRRSDPNFKKKLRERRRQNQNAKHMRSRQYPDLKDHEAVQTFFLQEVQMGEELLSKGEIDGGIEHLCNAVAVCGQPNQLLQVLQTTLPPHVFNLLVQRFPSVTERIQESANEYAPPPGPQMTEEDVE